MWESALQAKKDAYATWIHGDLHPRNVLIHEGKITGIIDWGDISSGDRATDLAAVWMLFSDRVARHEALLEYGADDDMVLRAKGWAVLFAVLLLETGLSDHPQHAAIGESPALIDPTGLWRCVHGGCPQQSAMESQTLGPAASIRAPALQLGLESNPRRGMIFPFIEDAVNVRDERDKTQKVPFEQTLALVGSDLCKNPACSCQLDRSVFSANDGARPAVECAPRGGKGL